MNRFIERDGVKIAKTAIIEDSVEIGEGSLVSDFALITGDVKLGKYNHVGHYTHLSGKHGITTGDFVAFSARCSVYTESDNYTGQSLWTPVRDELKKTEYGSVRIGDQVLFGWSSLIMPNVYISDGAIFGAKSYLKGRYFGDALFISEGNKIAQFKQELRKGDFTHLFKKEREMILNG